jgi:large conductance mechanosensitive channel
MTKALEGFKEFLLRRNALDLAIGVLIGSAFNAVVNSLVKSLLMPLIGALVRVPDFSKLSFVLHGSAIQYGDFLNALISLLIDAVILYFVVILPLNVYASRHKKDPTTKTCPECLTAIPREAKRCAACTQPQPAT